MKFTVLGASGYIGLNLSRYLIRSGHFVTGFGRSDIGDSWVKSYSSSKAQYFCGDFQETDKLPDALFDADAIIHLISSSNPTTAERSVSLDVATNLLPTVRLAERLAATSKVRLIYLSSGGTVYGGAADVSHESSCLDPKSVYGLTKANTERYLQYVAGAAGLRLQILRPSNVYGPIENRSVFGLVNALVDKVAAGQTIDIWGDGLNVRDYLYIDDLCSLICVVASTGSGGPMVMNVGSGLGHTVIDVISLIEKHFCRRADIRFLEARSFDVRKSVLDISIAKAALGWKPLVDLDEGVRRLVQQKAKTGSGDRVST